MVFAKRMTGLSFSLPLLSLETVLSLMSDFWSPKLTDTVSAKWRKGLS